MASPDHLRIAAYTKVSESEDILHYFVRNLSVENARASQLIYKGRVLVQTHVYLSLEH